MSEMILPPYYYLKALQCILLLLEIPPLSHCFHGNIFQVLYQVSFKSTGIYFTSLIIVISPPLTSLQTPASGKHNDGCLVEIEIQHLSISVQDLAIFRAPYRSSLDVI